MKDEYIKRSDALNEIHRFRGYIDEDMEYRMNIAFKRLPSADVQEVRHGKWVKDEDGCMICSECGYPDEINQISGEFMRSNFCQNCGADMRGGT